MNGRRITYQQAQQQNWPRPTCVSCYTSTSYDRYFRGARMCPQCFVEEPIAVQKKGIPCPPK